MDQYQFVQSKRIEDSVEKLYKQLVSVYKDNKTVSFEKEGETIQLSKKAAHFGILLLNGFPNYRQKDESEYWYHSSEIIYGKKRHKAFVDTYGMNVWDEETEQILWLGFGEEIAPLVRKAWDNLPKFMYQSGVSRRSFRLPLNEDLNYCRRLNFLKDLLNYLPEYNLTIEERLEYDSAIGYYNRNLAMLLITLEDEKWNTILLDAVYNRHPKIKVNTKIIKALLRTEKEENWKAIGDLLLAAQRQEGLRQSILENADEGSLGAFKYIINLMIEHKLSRFSSAMRAVETWIGLGWEAEKETTIRRFLELGNEFLNAPETIVEAIKSKDNAVVYMALWAQGVLNVEQTEPLLEEIWENGTIEKRCLVLLFVQSVDLKSLNLKFGLKTFAETHLQLFAFGLSLLRNHWSDLENKEAVFNRLETLLPTFPKKDKYFTGKVFAWTSASVDQSMIYNAMLHLIDVNLEADVRRILPYFKDFSVYQRERLTKGVLEDYFSYSWNRSEKKDQKTPTNFQKEFALIAVKDRGETVRSTGMEALKYASLEISELELFEKMLTRKSAGLREAVIDLLQKNKATVLGSVERLITSRNAEQRLAALDVVIQLQKKNQFVEETMILAETLEKSEKFTNREEILLQSILHKKTEYTVENGFGLYNPNDKTVFSKPTIPQSGEFFERRQDLYKKGIINKLLSKPLKFGLSKSVKEIEADLVKLKSLFLENKDFEYTRSYYDGEGEAVLLGNYVDYKTQGTKEKPKKGRDLFEEFPLYDVWENWLKEAAWTNFDLFTVSLVNNYRSYDDFPDVFEKTAANLKNLLPQIPLPVIDVKRSYFEPLKSILDALIMIYPYDKSEEYLIHAKDYALANVDVSEETKVIIKKERYYEESYVFMNIKPFQLLKVYSNTKSDELYKRHYLQLQWMKQCFSKATNRYGRVFIEIGLADDARAFKLGLITENELIHSIIRPGELRDLTGVVQKDRHHILKNYPYLESYIPSIRDRVLEIELQRGDKATAVTLLAQNINQLAGQDYLFRIVKALGNSTLNSGYIYSYGSREYSKKEILCTLLKRCLPIKTETQTAFNEAAAKLDLKEKRWVELAMYSQQWAEKIRTFLGWQNMESAVWWLHAHANARHDEETESEISRFSAMPMEDFDKGGVDVDWFRAAYKEVGKARWKVLYDAAKYISSGTGHSRAKLYADVLLGEKKIREITTRIKDKRNQDYLRVYGLVPLSKKTPQKDLLNRYLFIQQFLKESKQFGAQRQTSEALAAQISMENLARTAGFQDPIRLTWAMEAKQAQVILAQSKVLEFDGGVTVELVVSKEGKPSLKVERNEKLLKSIPAKLRKEKQIVELKGYVKQLKAQYVRSRKSLEEAMVRQDTFLWSEIEMLSKHPIINPILEFLVFKSGDNLGFASADGLKDSNGEVTKLNELDELVLAHSVHLYQANVWEQYQQYVFENKVKQPFKQIFRELYLPTEDELHKSTISKRYEGHQVQPQKTVALLKSRGWRVDYQEGLQKVHHKEGIIAKIYAMADWFSPADIEAPTLETIEFYNKKDYKPIPFSELSPVVFSEVMRDLDLVVSVAHVGDVDPETSQSSMEMRGVLVKETARLFKLGNVEVSGRHVNIKGQLAEYSVHLGSAVVFQKPGRQLGIIPIHSQHRGRIFLPFADDDPKSAELLSKVLLLSKDNEIQDPTILRQLNLQM
jgi:hypothetical protein